MKALFCTRPSSDGTKDEKTLRKRTFIFQPPLEKLLFNKFNHVCRVRDEPTHVTTPSTTHWFIDIWFCLNGNVRLDRDYRRARTTVFVIYIRKTAESLFYLHVRYPPPPSLPPSSGNAHEPRGPNVFMILFPLSFTMPYTYTASRENPHERTTTLYGVEHSAVGFQRWISAVLW